MKFVNLVGKRFGSLVVIKKAKKTTIKIQWRCICDCGNYAIVYGSNLTNGHTQSCGCLQRKKVKQIAVALGKARLIDLSGSIFGKLTVVSRFEKDTQQGKPRWLCRCECGGTTVCTGANLKNLSTQGCGCLARELTSKRRTKHGHNKDGARTPEYRSWVAAKSRCEDPQNIGYKYYGGRGIKMCEEWRSDFSAFLAHIGPKPLGRSLDRINVNGNYAPGNVRWATPKQQSNNQRRHFSKK